MCGRLLPAIVAEPVRRRRLRAMQLGVMVEGQEGLGWEQWRRVTALTDRLGFESIWRSDHLVSLAGHSERDSLEAWTSLVELATRGTRLIFGTLVSPVTFR